MATASTSSLLAYELKTPSWRPPWQRQSLDAPALVAYPGHFETHQQQEEDNLNDYVVKNGFISRPVVQVR